MQGAAGLKANPVDLAAIRDWFARLGEHVRAEDFAGARALFVDDLLVFGTFQDFVEGRDEGERTQWRNVWPAISDFHWRLDGVRAFVSPDRLFAVGLAIWDSTGYHEDGSPFARPGRATVSLERRKVGDRWVANHTHMSLFRGVPAVSFGKPAA